MAEIKVKAPTQKELYERIMSSMAEDKEVVAFCEKKIEQLARKTSNGNSKKADEQNAFIDLIVDVLTEAPNPLKCSEILKDNRISTFAWADGKETSSQRVSAHLKKMVDGGNVRKFTDKKETFFELV